MKFSDVQKELVFEVAHQLTGCSRGFRAEIVLHNIMARMRARQFTSLVDYLNYALQEPQEKDLLISALTIHTTQWFRDYQQLCHFHAEILALYKSGQFRSLPCRILSAGCSSGQEVYSLAISMQRIKKQHPDFDFEIVGYDIDPVNLQVARSGQYHEMQGIEHLEHEEQQLIKKHSGQAPRLEISRDLRNKVCFKTSNLLLKEEQISAHFDACFCRNVLIYFDPPQVISILDNLSSYLRDNGILVLGSGEVSPIDGFPSQKHQITRLSAGIFRVQKLHQYSTNEYRNQKLAAAKPTEPSEKRILVVDDDPECTKLLQDFAEELGFECDSFVSPTELIKRFAPSKYTLMFTDYAMPELNGEQLLQRLKIQDPNLPCILVSGYGGREFFVEQKQRGFVDVLPKPIDFQSFKDCVKLSARHTIAKSPKVNLQSFAALSGSIESYLSKNSLPRASGNHSPHAEVPALLKQLGGLPRPDIVLLGASTGGPQALLQALMKMPKNCPPILLVQHISADFSLSFAKQLTAASNLILGPTNSPLQPGHIYVSLENRHLQIKQQGQELWAVLGSDEKIHGQCPAVDALFESAALLRGARVWAALFTGMGRDGGQGLAKLKRCGALTFSQSEQSCVVYGMPKYAFGLGASQIVGTPAEFRSLLLASLDKNTK